MSDRPSHLRTVIVVLVAIALAAAAIFAVRAWLAGPQLPELGQGAGITRAEIDAFEPFAFDPGDADDFLERGARGNAHVLYAKSPDGVEASAARTLRFRDLIEEAAERRDVDAETLTALVFLESAGRPEIIAGPDPESAAGLAQILPGTATSLLGMSVDLKRSKTLTRRIERDRRRAREAKTRKRRRKAARRMTRLRRERSRIDERFDPRRALDGAARYLEIGERRFGREGLAAASYHMGIGNLGGVIETYIAPRRPRRTTRGTVDTYELSYPRLYFDSSPLRNPRTYRKLLGLGDDSRTYLFRLEASREIMRLYADDREELRRRNRLQLAKASAEEVLRPEQDNPSFEDADELRDAYDDGDLARLPDRPRRLGYRVDSRMGALARRLGESPRLYQGLRPEALAGLLYIAKETRLIAGGGTLRVTSTVRDEPYQRELVRTNSQATRSFSLHTTGYAIDIARDFRSKRQERAFIYVLDRLKTLDVIDWVYEPGAIHLTVGPDADRFMPLYEGLVARR